MSQRFFNRLGNRCSGQSAAARYAGIVATNGISLGIMPEDVGRSRFIVSGARTP
jgi:hypothetical protein